MRVSRAGYLAWRARPDSRRSVENEDLLKKIKEVRTGEAASYGSPRVWLALRKIGVPCSENRVARIMRVNEIRVHVKRRHIVTTDSKHSLPIADNLLNQNFDIRELDKVWAGDITYIPTGEGWLYLAAVLDLGSRRCVGWSMKPNIDRSIVIDAFNSAHMIRRPEVGLIFHSDRGSQYASGDYQKTLKAAGALPSMSGKGNCYDNAPMESFFSRLKGEFIQHRKFATRQEARAAIFKWITLWYNSRRIHSYAGNLSPNDYEAMQRSDAA